MFDSVFEGFAIWFKDSLSELDVQALITPTLGSGWQARPFGDRSINKAMSFKLTSSEHLLSVGEAWELSYRLREVPGEDTTAASIQNVKQGLLDVGISTRLREKLIGIQ